MNKLHKGAPPSIGWWPATFNPEWKKHADKKRMPHRWWNGYCWSISVWDGADIDAVKRAANTESLHSKDIYWTSRWWK